MDEVYGADWELQRMTRTGTKQKYLKVDIQKLNQHILTSSAFTQEQFESKRHTSNGFHVHIHGASQNGAH